MHHLGTVRNLHTRLRDASEFQLLQFCEERIYIDRDARTEHVGGVRVTEDARWEEVEDELAVVIDNRMSEHSLPPWKRTIQVRLRCEDIRDLSLTLITPVCTYQPLSPSSSTLLHCVTLAPQQRIVTTIT